MLNLYQISLSLSQGSIQCLSDIHVSISTTEIICRNLHNRFRTLGTGLVRSARPNLPYIARSRNASICGKKGRSGQAV